MKHMLGFKRHPYSATKHEDKKDRKVRKLNKFVAVLLVSSMISTSLFAQMHSAVIKMKDRIKNNKQVNPWTQEAFLENIDRYSSDYARAWIINLSYRSLDDSLKNQYYIELIEACNKISPEFAFSRMCEFIGNNYDLLTNKQKKELLTLAIQYGEDAKEELQQYNLIEKIQEYNEGLSYLRLMLEELTR